MVWVRGQVRLWHGHHGYLYWGVLQKFLNHLIHSFAKVGMDRELEEEEEEEGQKKKGKRWRGRHDVETGERSASTYILDQGATIHHHLLGGRERH